MSTYSSVFGKRAKFFRGRGDSLHEIKVTGFTNCCQLTNLRDRAVLTWKRETILYQHTNTHTYICVYKLPLGERIKDWSTVLWKIDRRVVDIDRAIKKSIKAVRRSTQLGEKVCNINIHIYTYIYIYIYIYIYVHIYIYILLYST